MNDKHTKPAILIADDEPENIRVLSAILMPDYRVMAATSGVDALELAVSGQLPDLVLLDIMMPEMDGYDVCRRLKKDARTKSVPVIFITALNGAQNEARGLAAGASDYITKPFDEEIVRARTQIHIELKRHRDHLEALARQRADQLVHSERLATVGTLSAGVFHELSNQFYPMTLTIEMLKAKLQKFLSRLPGAPEKYLENFPGCMAFLDDAGRLLNMASQNGDQVIEMMNNMRKFTRQNEQGKERVSVANCINNALQLYHNALKNRVRVIRYTDGSVPDIYGNAAQLEQVLINLFKNAVDALKLTDNGHLIISTSHEASRVRITVEDNGPGIPEESLEKIWQPFFSTKKGQNGLGLGLSITRNIIEQHGGRILAENRKEKGSRFIIDLPL